MKRVLRFICIASLSAGAVGCSSVFYYPDHNHYVEANQLPIVPQDETFQSGDGTKLHAWLFKPPGGKARAVMVHFHGNAQNLTSHFAYLRHAPGEGFEHLIFDYRGYGDSEGKPSPAGLVEDGKAALRFARERKLPIIVVGQSLGGAVALKTLIELHGEIPLAYLVIDSSFLSYRSEARSLMGTHWLTWILQPVAWLIADNSQSPKAGLKEISGVPLLVVHGDHDRTVAFWQGQDIFERANEPKEFWSVPIGGHTDFLARKSLRDKFYAKMKTATGQK